MELFTAVSKSLSDKYTSKVIESFDENEIFTDETSLQSIINLIDDQLASSKTRYAGLLFLNQLLNQCNIEAVSKHILTWIGQCFKALEEKNSSTQQLSFEVINVLLEVYSSLQDKSKNDISNIINKIIQQITAQNIDSATALSALTCLETLLKCFNGPCGAFKPQLEEYLLKYIDCLNEQNVQKAGKCLHFLQQVSGGGVQGIGYKMMWQKQHLSLCATLHSLLDELYKNANEIHEAPIISEDKLRMPALLTSSDIVLSSYQIATRFCNVVKFLQEMLICEFPVAKTIEIETVLKVVCRASAVTCEIAANNKTLDTLSLAAVLPTIHKNILGLLYALIISFESLLIPYGTVICHIILQTLVWTSKSKQPMKNPYSNLRIQAYKTLSCWAIKTKAASNIDTISKKLVPIIISDITFQQKEDVISVKGTHHMSKKERKKMQKGQIQNHSLKNRPSFRNELRLKEKKINICVQALQTLQDVLYSVGTFLEQDIHKDLQELLHQLLNLNSGQSNLFSENSKCLEELYATLISLVLNTCSSFPPPTQCAVELLSVGQNSSDINVSRVCIRGLAVMRTIIYPSGPTLNLPIENEYVNILLRNKESKQIDTNNAVMDIDDERSDPEIVVSECGSDNRKSENVIDDDTNLVFINSSDSENEIISVNEDVDVKEPVEINYVQEISSDIQSHENDDGLLSPIVLIDLSDENKVANFKQMQLNLEVEHSNQTSFSVVNNEKPEKEINVEIIELDIGEKQSNTNGDDLKESCTNIDEINTCDDKTDTCFENNASKNADKRHLICDDDEVSVIKKLKVSENNEKTNEDISNEDAIDNKENNVKETNVNNKEITDNAKTNGENKNGSDIDEDNAKKNGENKNGSDIDEDNAKKNGENKNGSDINEDNAKTNGENKNGSDINEDNAKTNGENKNSSDIDEDEQLMSSFADAFNPKFLQNC